MDGKDKIILELLSKNARLPYSKIAKKLGISETAVRKRIRKLEEKGIIEGYTLRINPVKIGYRSIAHVGIDTDPNAFLGVACKLKEMDAVRCVAITSGGHMIMTDIWARNSEELNKILAEIEKIEGVKKVNPSIILEMLKSK